MTCPICSGTMQLVDHSGVTIDQCTACKALWFDRTEFAASMERDVPGVTIQWGKSVKDRHGPARACPRDGIPMKAMEWDGVPFDRCGKCAGVLLTEQSWEAVHREAEARAKGSRFSPVEIMRDLFNM